MGRIDISGQKYGRLTAIEYAYTLNKKACWLCECECGSKTIVRTSDLRKGHTNSCGCLQRENSQKNIKLAGTGNRRTHGGKGTKLYEVWKSIRQRCNNPGNKAYKQYGGRDIKICADWDGFHAFRSWAMNSGYEEGLTIERKDVDGDYEPSNCEWISLSEQQGNKTNTTYVNIKGETKTLADWSRISGIPYGTVYGRYHKGYKGERLISKNHGNKRA